MIHNIQTTLSDLTFALNELRQICLLCDHCNLQYLPPLFTKKSDLDDSPYDRIIDFDGTQFTPQPVVLRERIKDIWGFSTPPNRLKNSLPRYLGHFALRPQDAEKGLKLIHTINELKKQFSVEATALFKEHGYVHKENRLTDALIDLDVITETDNAEMIIRPILSSYYDVVTKASNRWVTKPSQPWAAKTFEDAMALLEADDTPNPALSRAMQQFEAHYPNSKYAIRYENFPAPEIRYNYYTDTKERGLGLKRIANASPLIICFWDNTERFDTSLQPLECRFNTTTNVISMANAKVKFTTPVRLLDTENWFGFRDKLLNGAH
ncbi:hypothetical protein [Marinomonas algarum]|uniref:Uncharacterized protein n=1 Tax=Marinomonas algarum TaxID=2883105 RepID=A0A9X1RVU1_9GAMM|nr:hypothetical protein [Marinomonas algarum]MCB5162982.1 hypothetical protein [Marinomonas algarum]